MQLACHPARSVKGWDEFRKNVPNSKELRNFDFPSSTMRLSRESESARESERGMRASKLPGDEPHTARRRRLIF